MAAHAIKGKGAPEARGGDKRPKVLPGLPISPERVDPLVLQAANEQAAHLVRESLETTGVGQAWLASRLGVHRSQVGRICDPTHERTLSLRRLLLVRLIHPRLYFEIVRSLVELEAGDGEPWKPQNVHTQEAGAALGQLCVLMSELRAAPKVTRKLRRELDRGWHELEMVCRQARRDLGRGQR